MSKKHNFLMKKGLAALMVIMMAFSIVMPSSFQNAAYAKSTQAAKSTKVPAYSMVVSNNKVSMTEARNIDVAVNFGYKVNTKDLVWTFGGKSFSQWQKWDAKAQDFKGSPFITFAKQASTNGNVVNATIKFDLPFDTVDLSPRSIRVQYPKLIGNYSLQVKDKSTGVAFVASMKLNAYDDYHTYAEFKPTLDQIKANARPGRYVSIESLGKTEGGNEMWFVVIAKDKASVDKYLNEQVPQMYTDPASLAKKIKDPKFTDYKVAVWMTNTHPDEAHGTDAIISLVNQFATQDEITYKAKKADASDNSPLYQTINVNKTLDKEILLFQLAENPDGRVINRRALLNGLDPNRDYSFQTQVESQHFAAALNKWAPLSMLDFHGYYSEFVLEPCTGPHNPSYEYDILMDGMIPQAFLVGQAAVANTKYKSYDIPQFDLKDSFDDAAPVYTAMYAMINGTMAHTFEVPELNEEGMKANQYGALALYNYVYNNTIKLFGNQLEIFNRQINNIDDPSVDRWFRDVDGNIVGRPRGTNTNYFPEYYVLPMDKSLQKNTSEATKMVQQFLLDGVKVQKSTAAVTVNGKTYPAGSYVIPMHQAHRDLANSLLNKGEDYSEWQAMYAEIVSNFPDIRGFTADEVRVENAFAGKVVDVTSVEPLKTVIPEDATMYVVKNSSNEAIKAVNELLYAGKSVKMVTAATNGYSIGDYLVSKADLEMVKDKYDLDVVKATGEATAKDLKPVKVYALKSSSASYVGTLREQSGFVLKQLGFNVVDNIKDADVVVDSVGTAYKTTDMAAYVKSGKPYIGIGGEALDFLKEKALINDFEISDQIGNYFEGALKGVMTENNIITAGYNKDATLYCTNGEFITKAPQDATVLERISDKDDFYLEGWWPGHEAAKGQILAIQYKNMVVFGNDLTNKGQPAYQFRLLANSIYSFQVK